MKKLTLILAAAILFASVSFGQSTTQEPIKPTPNHSKYPHKSRVQKKEEAKKTAKPASQTPAAK